MTELSDLIRNYTPNQATIDLVKSTRIVLIVGVAGAGKDTIKRQMLAQPDFCDIISHTTRAPRKNSGVVEKNGVDYHFVDETMARKMVEQHDFIETKYVHGTVYGTSVDALKIASENHHIAVTDIDVQGVDEYKTISRDVVAIFIVPPSYDVWQQRLKKRYASEEEFAVEWPKRRASAISELETALRVPYYHFIINDNLDEAVKIVSEISKKSDTFHRKDDEIRLKVRDLLDEIRSH